MPGDFEREREEFIERSSRGQTFFERYTMRRHPAALRYRRGRRSESRSDLLQAVVFLAAVVGICGAIVLWLTIRG